MKCTIELRVFLIIVLYFYQSDCEQKGESYWYSVTASVVTRIVENIEVIFSIVIVTSFRALCCCYSLISEKNINFAILYMSLVENSRCPLTI